jgi:hypothetical protein
MEIKANGDKEWYFNGKLHRDGGLHAIERVNGNKLWYVNGTLHRPGGFPSVECVNGDKIWYVNGELHRDGGLPAVERGNGDKTWYVNGKRHRDNGLPARELSNGEKEWWVNGVQYYPRYYPDRWTRQQMTPAMVGQTCIISLETIQNDSEVCKCDVCHSLSLFSAMEEWLNVNETCPHCRSQWNNWVKYGN